jgi:hypothetical protein
MSLFIIFIPALILAAIFERPAKQKPVHIYRKQDNKRIAVQRF